MNSNLLQISDNFYDINLENLFKKLSTEFIKSFTAYENNRKIKIETLIKK